MKTIRFPNPFLDGSPETRKWRALKAAFETAMLQDALESLFEGRRVNRNFLE